MKFNFLKKEFFEEYKNCKEMEKKEKRPFALITLIKINDLILAVPIRSHIKHKYAFFTDLNKSKGLDFSKSVVIKDVDKFIDKTTKVYINDEEYKKLLGKEKFIEKKLESYIKKYKKALETPNTEENKSILKYSALQYFHKELEIEITSELKIMNLKKN